MATKPLITVIGATGAQGGSVINFLLADGKWKVRGVTRNLNSDKAKALIERGIEMVQADVKNRSEVINAFKGSYGVFAVTNFWDADIFGGDKKLEVVEGKLMADVAEEVGVKHYIWSSLHDVKKISGGTLDVPHFTQKNEIEQYIRAKPNLPSSFVYAACYMNGFKYFFAPIKADDGSLIFNLPIDKVKPVALIDISDIGALVTYMFNHKEQYLGKNVLAAGEYITMDKLVETVQKVTGKKAIYNYVPPQDKSETSETFRWFTQYGYYNGEDISEARKIYPQIKTWADFIKVNGF